MSEVDVSAHQQAKIFSAYVEAGADLYPTIFEFIPCSILLADDAGLILLANRETECMFGYHPELLVGRCIDMLVPDLSDSQVGTIRGASLVDRWRRAKANSGRITGRRRDGREFLAKLELGQFESKVGRFNCIAISDTFDCSPAKRKNSHSPGCLEELVGLASREIETTIWSLSDLAWKLHSDLGRLDFEEASQSLELFEQRMEEMEALAQCLTEYAKESLCVRPPEPDNLAELIAECVAGCSVNSGVQIVQDIPRQALSGGGSDIGRVMNLVLADAMRGLGPDKGVLAIRARVAGNRCKIDISGEKVVNCHPADERVIHLFQPKDRAAVQGTAEGLALADELTRENGGSLWLQRGTSGSGVHVRLWWPLSEEGAVA